MTVAHVTGAARGIGQAIAFRLAEDGHDVAVSDLASMSEELEATRAKIESTGVRSIALTGDVSEHDSVRSLVSDTAAQLGSLDVMVANAGIAQTKALLDVTPEEFDKVLAVNARGAFLCYTEAARQMIEQGSGGKIIGAASIAAHKGFPLLGVYCSSKFALRALTQAAAQEWAPHKITVNAYCPGIVDTTMWEEIDHDLGEINQVGKGESMKAMAAGITLGRVSTGDDVAKLVSFLAGPDSDYITGQSILVDGGMIFV
ncbi:meso-butanediol dehydrogenase/(S,S)-butanediol dehydrogenase/diacetyl reductase [Branchiibius hedensis]|uniref:diacetyl reductase [(S)-acetoin forming] n=1 Tax=Branchiibius hedensis TaxID=672460 RepID=A0A2Y9A167_9MICO|nr:acetoin reductase [Branchiibius hedensis]PWJ27429.1 meso-butanediol dehydrogenase/(S,S)-butanediol dehydrogenase/diacetyl reductase [Branchiibius hedensis]SSA36239.1 meso-butanediol dehydrogenase / (S,S)-butanediol dehydrogenase / diacetyl reductase [Branchiibius hedensis]